MIGILGFIAGVCGQYLLQKKLIDGEVGVDELEDYSRQMLNLGTIIKIFEGIVFFGFALGFLSLIAGDSFGRRSYYQPRPTYARSEQYPPQPPPPPRSPYDRAY